MLFPDSRERSTRRPGAVWKEIRRGLHDVSCTKRVRKSFCGEFCRDSNRSIQVEMRRSTGRTRHGVNGGHAQGRMPHLCSDQFHVFGHQGGWNECSGFHFTADHYPQALDQEVTKRSPTLGRDAVYSQHSRLERLPAYLTVHMVRFAWKADISKKVKIMVRELQPTQASGVDCPCFSSVESNSRQNMTRWISLRTS